MTTLDELREDVHGCRHCELYRDGPQAVFSVGPASASIVLVGEQPGDHEDRVGEPFVGPAGRVLDEALELAEIARRTSTAVVVITTHPCSLLRLRDRGDYADEAAASVWRRT